MLTCLTLACSAPEPAHTFIPAFDPRELAAFGSGEESGVMVAGTPVARPPGGPLREGEEAPLKAAPDAGDGPGPGRRAPAFRPDRVTELEGTLGYFEVFTPSVAPFKRVSALDGVVSIDGLPVLGVSNLSLRPMEVTGLQAKPPDTRERDRFWGSVVLDFSEGTRVPLPTVSPESRILSASTDPALPIQFERDGADNFFVSTPRATSRQVRLIFVLDAPRNYFGAALPETPNHALDREVFPLPDKVARDALRFAKEIDLARGMPVGHTLRTLVAHFRSFEESATPPKDSGNILLDLARGRRGVCRHRTYAFVIVAQALGIPARFVQNEAHAWAEVKVAEVGWMRIDLGGAAEGLDARSLRRRPMYRPGTPDPWPRPIEYRESYARAAALAQESAKRDSAGGGTGRGRSDMRLTRSLDRAEQSLPSERDEREPTTLRVARYVPEVMRGNVLEVDGSTEDASGKPIAGLRIEVSLAEVDGERAVLLGVHVTDDQGRFRGAFAVPPDLEPADYALVVITPGNAVYGSARAQ